MKITEKQRVPLITAIWMISLPLAFAFVAGAAAGTVLDPIARFAGTVWSIFGGASLIFGLALLGWVGVMILRGKSSELNG